MPNLQKAGFYRREAIGGLTTFLTMVYIVVVNPSILSQNTGMSFDGVLTATVLLAFSMTLLMGLFAKLPFAVAPGMGINAFFAISLVIGQKIPWPVALGMVFWAGVLFLVLSILPVRQQIALAIPHHLRHAAAVGIGIFLTFIGLKNMGFVTGDPVTLVRLGNIDKKVLLALAGLFLIIFLMRRKNSLAFLAGIFGVTAVAGALGWVSLPEKLTSLPDVNSVFLQLDIWGALKPEYFPSIIAICLTDLFDSLSTFVGVSEATDLVDEKGDPKNLKEGLLVDAVATLGAGLFGTSSGTAYIESTAGIEAGGRTGWTAIFTALFFLPCFFIAPLAASVPAFATAPVLIIVGAMMFKTVSHLALGRLEDLVPAFLTIVLIPLTFSITQGILWGFVAHVVLYAISARLREVGKLTIAIAAVAVGLLWLEYSK